MSVLLSLFLIFFRIGAFSFGGGLAMLPLIFQSVQQFGMMSAEEFSQLVALSQATPGPIATNAATYVGYHTAGLAGAMAATIGVTIPSFIFVLTAMHFLKKFEESKGLQAAFAGIRPVTVGLVATAVVLVAQTVLTKGNIVSADWVSQGLNYVNPIQCGIFLVALVLAGKAKWNPIIIILLAGAAGAMFIH